jgi:23S rRNA pseudouridine1911/1915/1917 synthase
MPETPQRFQFVADRGDAGRRLDQALVRRVSGLSRLSRTTAQRWIESGAVEVDGRQITRASATVHEGATVGVMVPASAPRRTTPAAEPAALDIRYEDDDVIVVNKPPGLVVHPIYKQTAGTYSTDCSGTSAPTRCKARDLTRPTRTRPGWSSSRFPPARTRRCSDAAAARSAALRGGHHRAVAPLDESRWPRARPRRIGGGSCPAGRGAERARYEVWPSPSAALVRCELVTGRTHQIRVHLSARGLADWGDRLYGGDAHLIGRQAARVARDVPHPVTRPARRGAAGSPMSLAAERRGASAVGARLLNFTPYSSLKFRPISGAISLMSERWLRYSSSPTLSTRAVIVCSHTPDCTE